ncbi:hypothetical protein [Schleiferilactobacillus harbinensis]|uniref:hypothetical protein n=1 Tax=Schleiferilactobacillus harbinensis TaxID=304207 RepID=UPI00345E1555
MIKSFALKAAVSLSLSSVALMTIVPPLVAAHETHTTAGRVESHNVESANPSNNLPIVRADVGNFVITPSFDTSSFHFTYAQGNLYLNGVLAVANFSNPNSPIELRVDGWTEGKPYKTTIGALNKQENINTAIGNALASILSLIVPGGIGVALGIISTGSAIVNVKNAIYPNNSRTPVAKYVTVQTNAQNAGNGKVNFYQVLKFYKNSNYTGLVTTVRTATQTASLG